MHHLARALASLSWQALPAAQPWKFMLPCGAQDEQKSIAMQLRNEHGQSPIVYAMIEFRLATIGMRGPCTEGGSAWAAIS
ncbi:MAG: hypothetical protein U5L05_03025 [Rubrivivax sp.]|nr:hypothetical protein [Rubrivivax sp.]